MILTFNLPAIVDGVRLREVVPPLGLRLGWLAGCLFRSKSLQDNRGGINPCRALKMAAQPFSGLMQFIPIAPQKVAFGVF